MTLTAVPEPTAGPVPHELPPELEHLRIHLVGIGGCGMSALAALLLRRGTRISGSDRADSQVLSQLVESGAAITTVQRAESVPGNADLVVTSAAIPPNHPELMEARRRGLPVFKYAELLGAVMARYEGVAISGTHGKSTTTAWLTYVLRRAGLDPNFVVGATVGQLGGSSGVGVGRQFIAEACEFDRSFLNLRPRHAAILNIEEDHLDCYADLQAIRTAFGEFARLVPEDGTLVLNGHDPQCALLSAELQAAGRTAPLTFGYDPTFTWSAVAVRLTEGTYSFEVCHRGKVLGRVQPLLAGRHNVLNALAVIALAERCGVTWTALQPGLVEFRGADRRLELRGEVEGVRILDDYAHHPTEIRATLQAARERFSPRRLWCVFQPHQHSRTRFLLSDFAQSFSQADHVLVPDIYFVRDTQRDRELVSAEDLVREIRARGGDAQYLPQFEALSAQLAEAARPGDVVITMGAGNIWKVADELVARLRGHLPA